ncbi:hypothetical protein K3740_03480 [Ruegeria conchae]|uniref:hypothetical protein n=1 Tax=Ruegeria conchae TaxID=981384 RepID=UPI0021A7017E|nr:hypothetical protein [Ruegeria conchae]UWR03773.1 hypothetical protein K3740_03480 [Ruegeria conchae]
MQHDSIPEELRRLSFEFFYWFSRFEFALKECEYLRSNQPGSKAEASWWCFINRWKDNYQLTEAAKTLIEANPQRQITNGPGADLSFADLNFNANASSLEKVVRLAQAVRNNLFHGGKHGDEFWDDPDRMLELLPLVISILNELAQSTDLEGDYYRRY